MKCNRIIRRFLELDNYTTLPLSIKLHVLFCRSCREEILSLQKTFLSLRGARPFDMLDNLSSIIMNSIYASPVIYKRNVSSTKWLTVGSLIFLSMFAITYSDSFTWLKSQFGLHLEIPLNIVMGLAITIYVGFLVGSHIEETREFLKYFDREA